MMNLTSLSATSCVLVSVAGPDPKGLKTVDRAFYSVENGRTNLSASGIVFWRRIRRESDIPRVDPIVITSAMILAPFRRYEESGVSQWRDELIPGCEVFVRFESGNMCRCELDSIVHLDSVRRTAQRIFNGNVFEQRGIHLGCVAILRLAESCEPKISVERNCFEATFSKPVRGDVVCVVSSPFGMISPTVFQNSMTTGILSNVFCSSDIKAHKKATLFLTDARCLPGSEGGAVFNDRCQLIGMVAPSIKSGDDSFRDLGVIIPIQLLADNLQTSIHGIETTGENRIVQLGQIMSIERPIRYTHTEFPSCNSVALVSIKSSWGSGVLISKEGYMLTCAHLFKQFTVKNPLTNRHHLRDSSAKIAVRFRHDTTECKWVASLLFCSDGPVDIALIKLLNVAKQSGNLRSEEAALKPIKFVSFDEPPVVGQRCFAVGHGIFRPSAMVRSMLSAGVVSRVVPHPNYHQIPALIQSSSLVFRGHSGGALCDDRGRFLGLLTSNARHSGGSIIPSINFSIPIALIYPLIEAMNSARGLDEKRSTLIEKVFNAYDGADEKLKALWKLNENNMIRELQPKNSLTDKQSRFEEFMKDYRSKL